MNRHVRDERASREAFGMIGVERELPMGSGVAWCSKKLVGEWCFVDASHALLSLRYQGDIAACPACLRAIRTVIDAELAGKLHPELLRK